MITLVCTCRFFAIPILLSGASTLRTLFSLYKDVSSCACETDMCIKSTHVRIWAFSHRHCNIKAIASESGTVLNSLGKEEKAFPHMESFRPNRTCHFFLSRSRRDSGGMFSYMFHRPLTHTANILREGRQTEATAVALFFAFVMWQQWWRFDLQVEMFPRPRS